MMRSLAAGSPAPTAVRTISIFGATGSIGRNTLDVILQHTDAYDVVAITAHNDVQGLAAIAKQVKPKRCVIGNETHYQALKDMLSGTDVEVAAGHSALSEAAEMPADVTVAAIVGAAGLEPVLRAARQGRTIALANKESLVCAGEIVKKACRQSGATLIPVDSEHSAIFQVFDFAAPERVSHITLTASGGPFREYSPEQLADVTPQMAVRHPNWQMGAKISVDSATMVNKALEMIEAYHLFPLQPDQIEVLIHPQSVVHSLVHYVDGSVLAQLGTPDMRTPISYALAWPERLPLETPKLDLAAVGALHFAHPDEARFPALRLARAVLAEGASAAIAFNAANEVAVEAFLEGRLPFVSIVPSIEKTLQALQPKTIASLEDVLACDAEARRMTTQGMQ